MMQDNENKVNDEEEINVLHFVVVILKRKKMIVGVTFAFAVITAVISLIMTPIYKAETKILPPQVSNSGLSSQILKQLGGSSDLIGSSLGVNSTNEQYVGMLKSRTTYDWIIDRFGLMEIYDAEFRETARARLDGSVDIKIGKDEIISVSVEDKDPKMAAEMANAFIEKLKEMTQTFAVTEASKRRLFFEEQLAKTKDDLLKAEEAMQGLQEKTGAISIDNQAKAVIESIADLRAQIAAKEVELKVMRTYAEPRNPDLQKAEEALKGMKEELQKLETKSGDNPDPLVPTGRMPEVGADYTRKLRDLKFQETLFELMANQYEMARVDEARDATIIQVLDKAVPPTLKSKPKRAIMVLIAAFAGFFLAVFAAFFMDYLEHISNDPESRKFVELIKKYSLFKWRS